MAQTRDEWGNSETKEWKASIVLTVYEMGAVATGLNACTLHSLDGSLVTGGYDKRKVMDC